MNKNTDVTNWTNKRLKTRRTTLSEGLLTRKEKELYEAIKIELEKRGFFE